MAPENQRGRVQTAAAQPRDDRERPEQTPKAPRPRSRQHGDGEREWKRPESVLIVVHTRALDCLLLERVRPSGFWQSVTGSLEWGETAEQAAARELREETGLGPEGLRDAGVSRRFPILPEWRARYAPGVEHNVEHLWYLELPERRPVRLNPLEHAGCRWFELEEAIATVSSWTNREALERLRN